MFDNAFFNRFPQNETAFLDDNGQEMRYPFPTYYQGSRGMIALFSGEWAKARAALPSSRLVPPLVGFGRAPIAVGAFQYLNPRGMAPYNEILFGIPAIHFPKAGIVPRFGMFVKRLIVDVPENVQRGKHLWGMDKSMGEFKFFERDDSFVCEVWRNDRLAVRLEAPAKGHSRRFEDCRNMFTEKDGRLLTARSCMSGRKRPATGQGRIKLGADPFAAELDSLGIPALPMRIEYIMNADHIMTLPLSGEPL